MIGKKDVRVPSLCYNNTVSIVENIPLLINRSNRVLALLDNITICVRFSIATYG